MQLVNSAGLLAHSSPGSTACQPYFTVLWELDLVQLWEAYCLLLYLSPQVLPEVYLSNSGNEDLLRSEGPMTFFEIQGTCRGTKDTENSNQK